MVIHGMIQVLACPKVLFVLLRKFSLSLTFLLCFSQVESYNPSSDQWTPCPSLKERKGSLAGAALGGKIFSIGGGNGIQCFSDVEMLDLILGRWISTRSMQQKVNVVPDISFWLL